MKAMFALALVTREAYAAGGVAALACVFLVFPNILCFLSCVKWSSSVYYIIYFTGNQQNFIPCRIKTHLYAAERFFLTAGDIDGIINNKRYIVRSRKEIIYMATTILNHALIDHKLTIMRDKDTKTIVFKDNLDEIAMLMAYEVTKELPLVDKEIVTPICPMIGKELKKQIILVPILRAGIGLVDGFRRIIPTAKIGHIGMARNEETLIPEEYYAKFPSGLEDSIVIIVDPMLATGGSASAAITNIKARGAKDIRLVCLVGAPEGVKVIEEDHPDVELILATLDEKLNEKGYIVPGLGDAGDRLFGTD